jgi:hypothetical protein
MTTTARRRKERGLLVSGGVSRPLPLVLVLPSNRVLPPLIAPDVDENANEPGFLISEAVRNGRRCAGDLQKRLLYEIQRFVGCGSKTSCEAVETVVMGIEESGQPIRRRLGDGNGKGGGNRQAVHTLLNAPESKFVGFVSFVLRARSAPSWFRLPASPPGR